MPQQTLRAGNLELVVDPARGGSVMAFRAGGFDLMRPWDGVSDDPRTYASFPLVPFSGRIDHGRFRANGREYQLPSNFPPEPHAIHGDGWTSAWDVVTANPTSVELELVHDDPGAPLRYRASQIYWLYPDRLEIAMAVTNRGPEPMPFGLGHHPYFGDRDQALLSAGVSGVWLPDDLNVPKQLEPVPALWGFRSRRPVDELVLDNVFQGWDGKARLDWPEAGRALVIEADDDVFQHLVVYVPPGKSFFCVEPVSMVGDGFNLLADGVEGTGVRVLEPGQSMRGSMSFRPIPA
jgi:aldose 1-epimerase